MNTDMWEQPTTQRNWREILGDPRVWGLEPGSGILACDRVGSGRMAEPAQLLSWIESLLYTGGRRDLQGKRVLISAGGTREHLDPVRFIGNPATGKMGIALAQAAVSRGAEVTLVCAAIAPHLLTSLGGVRAIAVTTAAQMQQVMLDEFETADLTIMSAAVADVKPASYSPEKLPKRSLPEAIALEPVPDIVAELGQRKQPHQTLVGFAAQTGDIVTPALDKLRRKQLDAIVANPIDKSGAGFGSDTNWAVAIDSDERQQKIEPCSKLELAHRLFDFLSLNTVGIHT
jgi:phosphopantothenoylcysteine decarboxylase/phosphopantothenate--cysteine ligase